MNDTNRQTQVYLESLSLWDSAPTAFGVAQPLGPYDFTWVYANHALAEHFDQAPGTMQGKMFRLLFPEGSDTWPQLVEATVRTGTPRSVTQYSSMLEKTLFCKTYCPLPGLCAFFMQDVSARVRMAQKTEAAQKRLGLILQNTTDAVFDFDLETRTLYSSSEAVERYGALAVIPDAPQTMLTKGLLREAGAVAFCEAICAMENGAQAQTFELELRFHPDMAMMWYSMKLLRYTDVLTRHTTVIGYVRNIDQQHRQHDRLREAAERDSLTGLFNRGAAELRLIPALRETQHFAFFVFDVDNFKRMNDTQGHAYGDTMLLCFAQALRGSFRQDELVWRHGGDEFCACVFGQMTHAVLEKRCAQVLQNFARVGAVDAARIAARSAADICAKACPSCEAQACVAQPCEAKAREADAMASQAATDASAGETPRASAPAAAQPKTDSAAQAQPPCPLTCSIGVAYGEGPREYAACFAAADAALFTTKLHGKNGYTLVELR